MNGNEETLLTLKPYFMGIMQEYDKGDSRGVNRERERIRNILLDYEKDILANAKEGHVLSTQMIVIQHLKNKIM